MRRRFLTLSLALLLLVAGPATTTPAAGVPASAPGAVSTKGALRLEARATKTAYDPGEVILIEASATNTGATALEYYLPTPCDSPFQATVPVGADAGELKLPRESELGRGAPEYCVQVVKPFKLAPGQTISERFAWNTADVTTGVYDVTVAFTARSWTDAPQASVVLPVTIGKGQTDLTDLTGHWALPNVLAGVKAGFVTGYPDSTFKPDRQVTRAELAKMLVVARNLRPRPDAPPSFTDTRDHWVASQGYAEAAVEAGILRPADYSQQALNPDTPATRRETAMMVVRALALERQAASVAPDLLPFADKAEVPTWAAGYILVANAVDVIRGYEDQTFRPNKPVTRAEAVTMLLRMQKAAIAQLLPDAALQVDGQRVAAPGILVMVQSGRHLAPLTELAAATGLEVAQAADGWVTVSRGAKSLKIKPAVPYGLSEAAKRVVLDVAPPVLAGGKLYVPEGVAVYLGLNGHWDEGAKAFLVVTK